MGQKYTKGSSKGGPGQVRKPTSGNEDFGLLGFDFPGFELFSELPEIPEIPEFPAVTSYADDVRMMMEQARKDTEKWFAEQGEKFDMLGLFPVNFDIDMDVKEYTDGDGYHVIEGRTKDGYVYIQRTKKSGNKTITKFEGYKDGGIIYKSNSDEDKVTYRRRDGTLIEVTRASRTSRTTTPNGRREYSWSKDYEGTIRTTHATVYKRKKKKSTNGKWLLIIAIAAAVIYYAFLR